MSREGRAEEIVVVRRRNGSEDDHHHGGVWKIAYADFMTAMMAFFLVMWLINASNTETKASIASYFNPIKLTHSVPRKKGLLDIDEKTNSVETKPQVEDQGEKEKGKDSKSKSKDKQVNYETGRDKKLSKAINARDDGTKIGDKAAVANKEFAAFQDPFNSLHRAKLLGEQPTADLASPVEVNKASDLSLAIKAQAEKLRLHVEGAARQIGSNGGPGIEVGIEGDGIVLSLTDTSTFGMFAVGSAEPNIETSNLIQNITTLLGPVEGKIIVRGHTDSRPYRGDRANNNWRLAMARAEAVYGMLVRAGIDEKRFERIEGHADRKPKIPSQPEAAANRRIEILLRMGRQ